MTEHWKILVVEDEWFIAEDHAIAIRRAGHEVVGPVPSVAGAQDRLAAEGIDAALLDIQLDGENTFGLADTLSSEGIPFAFLTGHDQDYVPPRFAQVPLFQKPTTSLSDFLAYLHKQLP